jgi:hypothetical protein
MSFECGLEMPEFHKIFIHKIMPIMSHAPILAIVAKCGLEAPTFHKILTHISISEDHLVII